MAVDSRSKRASALGFGLASLRTLPVPDSTVSAADRQHVAFSYAFEESPLAVPLQNVREAVRWITRVEASRS